MLKTHFVYIWFHTSLHCADICQCLPPDKAWHKVKRPKADYSGVKGEGVGNESRLEPCWSMLLIGSLGAMWAWWAKQFHEPKCGSGHVCRVMAWTRQQGLVPYIGSFCRAVLRTEVQNRFRVQGSSVMFFLGFQEGWSGLATLDPLAQVTQLDQILYFPPCILFATRNLIQIALKKKKKTALFIVLTIFGR